MEKSVLEPWGMAASTFESPLPEQLRSIAASGHRADGAVIPDGDNGEALMREILSSVSIEYGWVRDYTFLYVGIVAAIVLALLGFLVVRKRRGRSVQRNGTW